MSESERKNAFLAVSILSGFLSSLLEDLQHSENEEAFMEDRDPRDTGTIYTVRAGTFRAAKAICRRFLAREGVRDMLADECEDEAGHDLYLTCAGHGAGFWDGDYPEHGHALTEAARAVCQHLETYLGDDGEVYICGMEGVE